MSNSDLDKLAIISFELFNEGVLIADSDPFLMAKETILDGVLEEVRACSRGKKDEGLARKDCMAFS